MVNVLRIVDRLDQAHELLDSAQKIAEHHELGEELATLHWLRGCLYFPQGNLDGCLEEHQEARYHARRAGSRALEAKSLGGLGDAYFIRGRMRSAYEHFDACVALCKRHGLRDVEVANLPMRGATRYYLLDLDGALRDCQLAIRMAARTGNRRAEIVARSGTSGLILLEAGRLDEARRTFEISLEISKSLGALRFEGPCLSSLGRTHALQGNQTLALKLAGQGVERCRQSHFAFFGPAALATLALVTNNVSLRRSCLEEGEAILRDGAPSHAHFYFYYLAMDIAYASGDADQVTDYATRLANYTRVEPVPWTRFFIERGRALGRYLRDPNDAACRATLRRLRDEAQMVGLMLAAVALSDGAR